MASNVVSSFPEAEDDSASDLTACVEGEEWTFDGSHGCRPFKNGPR